jgi:glycosyltransferase domain-containing protein
MLNQLTIIIPTYNRHSFLKRIISFYSKSEFTHEIIIADSSEVEQSLKNKKLLSEFKSKYSKIKYFHTSDFFPMERFVTFYEKIQTALTLIRSPYVTLCADDDFLIPTSLNRFAEFLNVNTDYGCAKGLIYDFYVSKNRLFKLIPAPRFRSIQSNNAIERVWLASRYYQQSVYGLFRTEVFHEILCGMPKSLFRHQGWLDELSFSTFAAAIGKVMRFDCPHEYREVHDSNLGHVVSKWPDMIFRDEMRHCVTDYQNALRGILLNHHPDLGIATADKGAQASLIAFSKWYYDTRYRDSHNRTQGRDTLEKRDFLMSLLDRTGKVHRKIKNEFLRKRAMKFPETQAVMAAVAEHNA